jgi:hypothetical protein
MTNGENNENTNLRRFENGGLKQIKWQKKAAETVFKIIFRTLNHYSK